MLLIIETHVASDQDFQRWVCGNTHLIRVYSASVKAVQRTTCQTTFAWTEICSPSSSPSDWQLRGHWDLCVGLWSAHPLDRWCAVCYVDDTLLLPRTLRVGLDQNGRLKGQIASWEPNKWNGMNEIPQLPLSFFLSCVHLLFHSILMVPGNQILTIVHHFLHLTAILCYCMWLYMNIITCSEWDWMGRQCSLPLNVCLNCAHKIDAWVLPAVVKSPSNRESLASIWPVSSAC